MTAYILNVYACPKYRKSILNEVQFIVKIIKRNFSYITIIIVRDSNSGPEEIIKIEKLLNLKMSNMDQAAMTREQKERKS
jgi:hypothetical protein